MARPKNSPITSNVNQSEKNLPEFQSHHKTLNELAKTLSDSPKAYGDALEATMQQFIGLVQIATAGKVESVQELLEKPGNFMQKLLQEDKSLLSGYLEARALHEVLSRPSTKDPLEWARLLKDLIVYQESKKFIADAGPGRFDEGSSPGEAAVYKNELIQEVADNRREPGPSGDGQGDN